MLTDSTLSISPSMDRPDDWISIPNPEDQRSSIRIAPEKIRFLRRQDPSFRLGIERLPLACSTGARTDPRARRETPPRRRGRGGGGGSEESLRIWGRRTWTRGGGGELEPRVSRWVKVSRTRVEAAGGGHADSASIKSQPSAQ